MKEINSSGDIQVVGFVRTFAIMTVMAFHLKPTLPLPSPLFRWAWDHFQRNGEYGVCVFFVVSGFLITRIIDLRKGGLFKPDLKWFYVKRIGRIIPLFLLAVLLGVFLSMALKDDSKKYIYCFKLPSNPFDFFFWGPLFTFTFNFAGGNWDGVGIYWVLFWSLAVEEQFYLFYPLALKKTGKPGNLVWLLAAIVLAGLTWRWSVYFWGRGNISTSMRYSMGAFDQMAVGALLYLTCKRFGHYLAKKEWICFLIMSTGFAMVAATYLTTFPVGRAEDRVYGPTLIAAGVFFFILGGCYLEFLKSSNLKLFTLPGKFSYGNYLFHITVLYFIHSFLWNLNIVIAFLLFVTVTTGVSFISYRFYENPARRFVQGMFNLTRKFPPGDHLISSPRND